MWLRPLSTPIAPPVAARRSMKRAEIHRRPDLGRRRPAPRRCARPAPAPRRRRAAARSASRRRRGGGRARPSRLRPELVGARGAVDEGDGVRGGRRGHGGGGEAESRRAAGDGAESARHQLARAVQRMDVRLDPDRPGHQPARRPLVAGALGAIGEAVARAARQQAHQRRLGQPLQVDHRVVALAAQPPDRRRAISPRVAALHQPLLRQRRSGSSITSATPRTGAPAARSPARPPSRSAPAGCAARMSAPRAWHGPRRRATTA